MSADNKLLGQFDLVGIPPAARGIPQIEVTFDIDANGIVNVSAKDLGTGKEQKVTVTGAQKLDEAELEKMKKDAESHAEEDKKKKEEVEMLNTADTLIYATEKSMKDMEGKVDSKKLKELKAKVDELKKLMEPEKKDVAAVKKKLEELEKIAQEAATELYQKAQEEQAKKQAEEAKANPEGKKDKKDKVVDAEFKEKEDNNSKKAETKKDDKSNK